MVLGHSTSRSKLGEGTFRIKIKDFGDGGVWYGGRVEVWRVRIKYPVCG